MTISIKIESNILPALLNVATFLQNKHLFDVKKP